MAQIRIDDGTKEYKIENQYGKEICRIHFRPADLALLDRFENISSTLQDALKPLQDRVLKSDGSPADDKGWEALKEAEAAVIAKFNELLDTDDLGDIFKTRSPFSSVGGRFFCEIILAAIGEVIVKEIEKEAAATQKRLAKYMPEPEADNAGAASADA